MSKRARILVDPTVQWAIARRVLLHWCMLLFCIITISVMARVLVSAGDMPFSQSLREAFSAQGPLLFVMFILMPVFLRDTLKMSNRFAGPMYRLRTVLSEMANGGDGGRIKFRDGDFWLQAATDFNTVYDQMESLKTRNAELEAELEKAQTTV